MLQQFIPLLLMTFFICWFVVFMQFMWRYTDDFVGKGLDMWTLAKIFVHVAVMVLPTSLPLGVLLASLMTFGGMGERLELLAIKSAGIPLHKVMIPLFLICSTLAVGLFVYLNTVMMDAQVKFYQIAFSVRDKQPDLEIPEGSFYNGINNYSIFVQKKNRKEKALLGVLLYDISQGVEETRIIRADSGKLTMDNTKTFLTLDLYHGESFQQMKKSFSPSAPASGYGADVPNSFYKEKFLFKQIVIPFDANFKLQSDNDLRNQYVGKNLFQLTRYIRDTALYTLDSIGERNATSLLQRANDMRYEGLANNYQDTTAQLQKSIIAVEKKAAAMQVNVDSLVAAAPVKQKIEALNHVAERLRTMSDEANYFYSEYDWQAYFYRTHDQERHRKFTFPVACIVFFFIGAPLGAIIRKGGIGTPMVTCILLFIVYYMIDTYGYKMGYNGQWPVWIGMWISTLALLPLGVFLTYQATRDSASLNVDALFMRVKSVFKKKKRELRMRELVVNPLPSDQAYSLLQATKDKISHLRDTPFMRGKYSQKSLLFLDKAQYEAFLSLEEMVEKLLDYPSLKVSTMLAELPILKRKILFYIPKQRWTFAIFIVCLPLSLPIIAYLYMEKRRLRDRLALIDEKIIQLERLIAIEENNKSYTLEENLNN